MKLNSFDDLFNILISDCALIEENNLKLLPKMIDKCHSKELKTALEKHFREAREHQRKVKDVVQKSGIKVQKVEWESPLTNVFENIEKFISENDASPLLDAAMITMLQQIEHLEIAHYGTLREYSKVTERKEVQELFRSTLKEEKATDSLLIRLARESGINVATAKV